MEIGTTTNRGIYLGIQKNPFGRDSHTFENCHGGKSYLAHIKDVKEIPVEEYQRYVKLTKDDMRVYYGL